MDRTIKIPISYKVGGQDMTVELVDYIADNKLGSCCVATGKVLISRKFNNTDEQSESSRYNTFCHEWVHSMLDTIGRSDLSEDEVFVCSLSAVLAESILSMKFE